MDGRVRGIDQPFGGPIFFPDFRPVSVIVIVVVPGGGRSVTEVEPQYVDRPTCDGVGYNAEILVAVP